MSNKIDETKNNKISKCNKCEFFEKETGICKKGIDCSKTNFSKCNEFLVSSKLVMF